MEEKTNPSHSCDRSIPPDRHKSEYQS